MLRANLGPLLYEVYRIYETSPANEYQLIAFPFNEKHAVRCETLLLEAFGSSPQRETQIRSPGSYVFLRDGKLIGFARLQPSAKDPVGATWGMISSVVVSPQRMGVGRKLMEAMETEALSQGYVYSCIW